MFYARQCKLQVYFKSINPIDQSGKIILIWQELASCENYGQSYLKTSFKSVSQLPCLCDEN